MAATNGIGWEVQRFTLGLGWAGIGGVHADRQGVEDALAEIDDSEHEHRVYEALA